MIYIVLAVLGLAAGSFVNALVWRIHEQAEEQGKKKPSKARLQKLSIRRGRSMCPHCGHELAAKDLIPVFSWLGLGGKCRYCRKPISWQYPVVELATAGLFILSRAYWPDALQPQATTIWPNVIFGLWIVILVGLMALIVYDIRWMLLPNRIIYPFAGLAVIQAGIRIAISHQPAHTFFDEIAAIAIGGGIFYVIFQLSAGKWIGGGDVKLGWLLGLVVGTASKSLLFIFISSLVGSLISVPLLASHRLKRSSVIPFGPFLIIGAIITVLWGGHLLHWYNQLISQSY